MRARASPQCPRRTQPLRGGEDRDLDKRSASATPSPALTSLVACTGALRRALLRPRGAVGRLWSPPSLRGGLAHRPACALTHLFKRPQAKAVPVAAPSSAVVSARATGPG